MHYSHWHQQIKAEIMQRIHGHPFEFSIADSVYQKSVESSLKIPHT